jgi:bifunctional non-homologous end joining protein LigD
MASADYVPQLATPVATPPSGQRWWHEIKYDGYRIGCRISGSRITLISRNGKDWTATFPDIVEAAAALGLRDALIDGEVAALLPDGRTSFQALQNAARGEREARLVYFVFDLLRLDGASLEGQTLAERKARLERAVRGRDDRIRVSEHVTGDGRALLDRACRMGLEGVVSKLSDRPYFRGRSHDWLKSKCSRRQEFVVGGFTDPEGARAGIGALLVGCYDGGRLAFAGKVGTGFSQAFASALRRRLDAMEVPAAPFLPPPPPAIARRAHWVRPELVCEATFTEWTDEGMIRHPSFQGLREDKSPTDVRRERSASGGVATGRPGGPSARRHALVEPPEVAGVRITHPDRIVYPEPPTTKLEVARYYEEIGTWIVPHVAGRPLTLLRCPDGLAGRCSYMKHAKAWGPPALRRVSIQEKTKTGEYLVADDLAGIAGLVQMGVLEIHTWNSTVGNLERPDRIVLDLDPGDEVPWTRVMDAGRLVRKVLSAIDLDSWCKTTGGRGLHVVIPLVPHAGWQDCLRFARAIAEALARAEPERFTTRFARAGRERHILLDYLRNNRTNTTIAAFSTRARPRAPVSVPVAWDELRPSFTPDALTLHQVRSRLARLRTDPWKGYWSSRQKLTARQVRAVEMQRPPSG